MLSRRTNPPARPAPIIGPTQGTQEYCQSELPLLLIGKIACIILGPKSRAGLIAKPVGPPNPKPITVTPIAKIIAVVTLLNPVNDILIKFLITIVPATINIRTKVAIISVTIFQP